MVSQTICLLLLVVALSTIPMLISATTAPPPSSCAAAWTIDTNRNILGGVQQSGVSTIEACRAACLANTSCIGLDFNTVDTPNTCFFTLSGNTNSLNTANGINHHTINRTICACAAAWTVDTNRNILGGVQQSGVSTIEACRAACLANTSCIGLDFNTVDTPNTCFFTLSGNTNSLNTANGINHHTINRTICGSVNPSIPPPTTAPCAPAITVDNNRNIFGGVQQSGVNTVPACQAACIANTACIGFDFNTVDTPNTCFLTLSGNTNPLNTANGINHYTVNRTTCACVPAFTIDNNRNIVGGVQQSGVSTVPACQAACIANTACIGFDFNTVDTPNTCFLTLSGNTNQLNTANGINHYTINRTVCGSVNPSIPPPTTAPCAPAITVDNNRNIFGGVQQSGVNTVPACQAACIANTACIGFDFNTVDTPNTCFLTLSGNTNPLNTANGINHYTVNRTTCACVPAFTIDNNRNIVGGVQQSGVSTVPACQAACIANTACIGFDFNTVDTPNTCFLTLSGNTNQLNTANGINHYTINRAVCVAGSVTPAVPPTTFAPCVPAFKVDNNRNIPGGVQQSGVSTLLACQAACIANPSCIGLDFNTVDTPNTCFLTLSGNNNPLNTINGVNHYTINRTVCGTSPSGSTYLIWYLKTGGVLSIDPARQVVIISDNINDAAWLVTSPCLANNIAGFNGTSNCVSLSPFSNTSLYLRLFYNGNIVVENPANQISARRFNEETSFNLYSNVFFPASDFTSVQPAINPFMSYLTGFINTPVWVLPPAAPLTPAYVNSASFFSASATFPSSPVTATCSNVWTRTNGARMPLDSMVNSGYTYSQGLCRQKCLVYPNCVGISYNNGVCYLEIRSALASNALVADPQFIHYDLVPTIYAPCTRGCSYTWILAPIVSGSNLTLQAATNHNFLACRLNCVANVNCVGVLWLPGNASGNVPANCSLIVLRTWLFETIFPNGSTAYSLTRVTIACGPCSVGLHSAVDFSDSSSVVQNGVTSRTLCRTACVNNKFCTGYDFGGNGCSLSFTLSTVLTSTPNTTHFDIVRSACGNGCQDKFDFYQATTSATSTIVANIANEQACRLECQKLVGCVACDWNQEQGICAFSNVSNSRNLEGTSPGWNHYEWYALPICDNDSS